MPPKAPFPWSVFWSGFGADFVCACSMGADKVGAETAPKHAPWKAGFRQILFSLEVPWKAGFRQILFSLEVVQFELFF